MSEKILPCTFLLLLGHSPAHGAGNLVDGPNADLVVNPNTGNGTLDLTDTRPVEPFILSFFLQNEVGSFRPENARFPFRNTGTNTTSTEFEIGQTCDLCSSPFDVFDLGEIFPEGFSTPEQVSQYLTEADYLLAFDAFEFDIVIVPEPTAASTVIALVVFVAASRGADANRRRRQGRVTAC